MIIVVRTRRFQELLDWSMAHLFWENWNFNCSHLNQGTVLCFRWHLQPPFLGFSSVKKSLVKHHEWTNKKDVEKVEVHRGQQRTDYRTRKESTSKMIGWLFAAKRHHSYGWNSTCIHSAIVLSTRSLTMRTQWNTLRREHLEYCWEDLSISAELDLSVSTSVLYAVDGSLRAASVGVLLS